jgi:hypothetical protein
MSTHGSPAGWRVSSRSAAADGAACVQAASGFLDTSVGDADGFVPDRGSAPHRSAEALPPAVLVGTDLGVRRAAGTDRGGSSSGGRPLPAAPETIMPPNAGWRAFPLRLPPAPAVAPEFGQDLDFKRPIPGVTTLPSINDDAWRSTDRPRQQAAVRIALQLFARSKYPGLERLNVTRNTENCGQAVVAVDRMLNGDTNVRIPPTVTDALGINMLQAEYNGRWVPVESWDDIIRRIAEIPGSRGVVDVVNDNRRQAGHVFNVVNADGEVIFLDGQRGGLALLHRPVATHIALMMYHPTGKLPRNAVDLDNDVIDNWATISYLPPSQALRRSSALREIDERLRQWRGGGRRERGLLDQNEHELRRIVRAIERWRIASASSARLPAVNRLQREIESELADVAARRLLPARTPSLGRDPLVGEGGPPRRGPAGHDLRVLRADTTDAMINGLNAAIGEGGAGAATLTAALATYAGSRPARGRSPAPYIEYEGGLPWATGSRSAFNADGTLIPREDRKCVSVTVLRRPRQGTDRRRPGGGGTGVPD